LETTASRAAQDRMTRSRRAWPELRLARAEGPVLDVVPRGLADQAISGTRR
jgi:hypothetical protein